MPTNLPQNNTTEEPKDTKPHNFTWRQRAFIKEYAVHKNPIDAMVAAGYARKAARQQFNKLCLNPFIASELRRIEKEAVDNVVLSREKILEEQTTLALFAKNEAVRARVLRDLGEIQGMYVSKFEDITKRETVEEAEKKTIEVLAKFKGIPVLLLTETIQKLTRTTKQGVILPQISKQAINGEPDTPSNVKGDIKDGEDDLEGNKGEGG